MILYGRRRIGKTRLVTHWREQHPEQAVYNFSQLHAPLSMDITCSNWQQVFWLWHVAELTRERRIVGAGLSLQPTAHKLSTGGRLLYAWCALDALLYPPLPETKVQVESPCAATGTPVRLRVSAAGVEDVAAAVAVVSVVRPDDELSVRQGFCSDVHFFASAQAAAPWLDRHPDGHLLSIADACQLGRRLVRMQS